MKINSVKIFIVLVFILTSSFVAYTQTKSLAIKIKKDNTDILKGQNIYINNCSSCHENPKLGPRLNGVTEKYSKQWILDFTVNNELLIHNKDKDALKIWLEWKKEPMTVFAGFTKESLEQLYSYLKSLKKEKKPGVNNSTR